MKKVSLILVGGAVALGSLFTSCSKDKVAPVIKQVTVGASVADTAAIEVVGGTAKIGWQVTKGDNDFKSLVIRLGAGTTIATVKSADSITSGDITFTGLTAGEYAIEVTDKDDLKATKTFKIKVSAVGTPLTVAHSGIKLGNTNDTKNGSYYSLTNGAMLTADAKTKATSVDFAYNGTVISPNAVTNADIKTANASRITKFKVLPANFNFDNATTADLAALTIDGTSATADKDAIIAFVTQEGKKGILKITDKVTSGTGDAAISTITITVKK